MRKLSLNECSDYDFAMEVMKNTLNILSEEGPKKTQIPVFLLLFLKRNAAGSALRGMQVPRNFYIFAGISYS